MMVAVVAANEAGVSALIFYLAAYALMNLAAFAVITIRERQTPFGDDIRAVEGLGRERPILAWSLTISMLALAGLPGTAGFVGKLFLIEAAVDGDYTWLGVMIAVGTMISLAYYLRVVAAVWMRPLAEPGSEGRLPAMAGGSPEADPPSGVRCRTIIGLTAVAAAATIFFGVAPSPLVDWAANAGEALEAAFVD
jgi:NADH-quinone oxidoreductase subunit N